MEKGSSSSSGAAAAAESLNGLKFGKKIYFEDVVSGSESITGGGPSSYPGKKGRSGVAHGGQPPRCQVEGCLVDLSDAKTYYSRHKVCGMHSKSSTVVVAGIAQRFCQQCSRFHKLTEFDQGKRSCRRRLACHNERRRKPAQGPMLSPHFGTLSPTTSLSPTMLDSHRKTGGFLMDFSLYSTPTGRESWSNNTTPNGGFGNQLQLPWQANLQNPLPSLLQSSTTARPSYSNSVDCFTGVVSDSSSALSLLSIQQPWASRSQASNTGINSFVGGGTNANANGTTTALFQQPDNNPVGLFTCPPDLGLDQISNHVSGQYGGELGLAQPLSHAQFHELDHSRGYGSFI